MNSRVRTLFVGTSDFAVPILRALMDMDYLEIVGVVTQPDRPAGRKQELVPPAVKQYLLDSHSVKIFQPEKLKTSSDEILSATNPDLIIVASYGQFVPKAMLDFPKYKCLNVHVSLLPDLRGAVPMPMAILNGYEKTGVTVQIMGEGMDVGDVIAKREFSLSPDETTLSLTEKSSKAGAELLKEILPMWIDGSITPEKQDESKATYCYQSDIAKEKAEIEWNKSAVEIDRMVRAFFPWPIAWFSNSEGKKIKVYKSTVHDGLNLTTENIKIGHLFKFNKSLFVKTGEGFLELDEIQVEGKNKMMGRDALFLVN